MPAPAPAIRFVVAALVLITAMSPADAGRRVALVIGNSAYVHAPKLANPRNDAADIAAALRGIGFEVIERRDADERGLKMAVSEFARSLQGSEIALFYYAGHGLQLADRNYLVPVDAKVEHTTDVPLTTVDLSVVLGAMESGPLVRLAFLDACRDNPFAAALSTGNRSSGNRGLARIEGGEGTLMAFATAPGTVAADGKGRNSPFTAALVKYIAAPGLEIRQMLTRVRADVIAATNRKQIPWDSSSLTGDVYLTSATKDVSSSSLSLDQNRPDILPGTPGPTVLTQKGTELAGQCDFYASSPDDPERPSQVSGVSSRSIDVKSAVPACEAAVRMNPRMARLVYQLGRSYSDANDPRALETLESAAALDYAAAAYEVGIRYQTGIDAPKDSKRAFEFYQRAADRGHPGAMVHLGQTLFALGTPGAYLEARAYFERAANLGDANGIGALAIMVLEGKGGERNGEMARALFEKAAALGNHPSLFFLGGMYEDGNGVRKDPVRARQYYQRSADMGNTFAMEKIAEFLQDGRGGIKDDRAAQYWRRRAIDTKRQGSTLN